MAEVMKIMVTSFKRSHAGIDTVIAPNPAACLCHRLLDTHGHVWVSLLWSHCSFILCPSAYKVLFVPSKSLFPWKWKWSHSVLSDSFQPHGWQPTRLCCPWDFPGKNTGMGCHFLLQGIFPTQGSNLGLLYCRQTIYHLSHQGSPFLVLCKFWWLCDEFNGDLLQECLCHTQVYYTQSPCPCNSPLLTCSSTRDTQTQFCLSLCGVSGSWCTQVCLSPLGFSGRYEVWFKCDFTPPTSWWVFSFAFGHGVSPQSHSSTMQPLLQCCAAAIWSKLSFFQ